MREQYYERLSTQAKLSKNDSLKQFSQAQLDYIDAIDEALSEEDLTYQEYKEALLLYAEMTEDFCELLQWYVDNRLDEIKER
ncbi:hypothetical protein HZY88_06245 [Aerococcaceae bacterium DSM 111176]|nr:hypothetical protein [Aerococcaceae bacterium DSM 111176]